MTIDPLPGPYYFVFGIYEPLLSIVSGIWAFFNPEEAFNQQAPWITPDTVDGNFSPQARVTMFQLINVCFLLGLINISILNPTRRYFTNDPAAQEVIYNALFRVLMFGDFAHIGITLYAMGPEVRWEFGKWSALTWVVVGTGITLLIPRALWHLGVGRGVPKVSKHMVPEKKAI